MSDSFRDAQWTVIYEATKDHNVSDVRVSMTDDGQWVWLSCDCGEEFAERWMYADHLRRLIQDALRAG